MWGIRGIKFFIIGGGVEIGFKVKATCYTRYFLCHNKLLVAPNALALENDEFNNLTFILTRILLNTWAMLSWLPDNGALIPAR